MLYSESHIQYSVSSRKPGKIHTQTLLPLHLLLKKYVLHINTCMRDKENKRLCCLSSYFWIKLLICQRWSNACSQGYLSVIYWLSIDPCQPALQRWLSVKARLHLNLWNSCFQLNRHSQQSNPGLLRKTLPAQLFFKFKLNNKFQI
jgi:hypothetical protein